MVDPNSEIAVHTGTTKEPFPSYDELLHALEPGFDLVLHSFNFSA